MLALKPIRGIELALAACSLAKPISIAASQPKPEVPSSIIVLGTLAFPPHRRPESAVVQQPSTSTWLSHRVGLFGDEFLAIEQKTDEQFSTYMFIAMWCCYAPTLLDVLGPPYWVSPAAVWTWCLAH